MNRFFFSTTHSMFIPEMKRKDRFKEEDAGKLTKHLMVPENLHTLISKDCWQSRGTVVRWFALSPHIKKRLAVVGLHMIHNAAKSTRSFRNTVNPFQSTADFSN